MPFPSFTQTAASDRNCRLTLLHAAADSALQGRPLTVAAAAAAAAANIWQLICSSSECIHQQQQQQSMHV
jgi:hypothetical protein